MSTETDDGTAERHERAEAVRAQVKQEYGSALARKLTDRGASALAITAPMPSEMRHAAALERLPTSRPGSAVVELDVPGDPGEAPDAGRSARDLRASPAWRRASEALADLEQVSPGVAMRAEAALRSSAVAAVRTRFYTSAGRIADELERTAGSILGPAAESAPFTYRSATQLCWLNRTMRTLPDLRALAEVADDDRVVSIDTPRRLTRELTVTTSTIGVEAYRHAYGLTGRGVVVAVLDSEVALDHPGLRGRVVHRRNYTGEAWGNPDEHGTAVASIIAGDGEGLRGVAPEAMVLNYKVLATIRALNGDDFGGAVALQQALEDGAHVANCSWGVGRATTVLSREARACDAAWDLGMVVVKSAGNSGPGAGTVTTPGEARGVVVVGATDRRGRRVEDYSSRGPVGTEVRPHLLAPGGGEGDDIVAATLTGTGPVGAGTSFAAPHVTGAVALMLQQRPEASPDEVRDLLLSACGPLDGVDRDAQGDGMFSFERLRVLLDEPEAATGC